MFRHADDVVLDEFRAFAGSVFGMLQGAFPFDHGPAVEIVGRHLGKDRPEIHLTIARRTEPSGPVHPALEAAIDALPPGRIELRVLDVEHLDPVFVDVDIVEIIQALQHVMRRIVEHVGARMVLHPLQEHLERDAVMQVLTGMDLITHVDAVFVRMIEDRRPAAGKLVEGGLDQTGRALRPGIDVGPGERAGKGGMRRDAEMLRGCDRHLHLLDRPFLTCLRIAAHFRRSEAVEGVIIGRMHGDQLPLKMGGQFGHFDTVLAGDTGELVAVILRRGSLSEVDQLASPGRHLHTEITLVGRPFGDAVPAVKRRLVSGKLTEKNARTLDRLHGVSFPICRPRCRARCVPQTLRHSCACHRNPVTRFPSGQSNFLQPSDLGWLESLSRAQG